MLDKQTTVGEGGSRSGRPGKGKGKVVACGVRRTTGKGMAGKGMYGTGIQAVMPESVRVRPALPLLAPPNVRLTVAADLNPQSPTFAQIAQHQISSPLAA